MAPDLPRLLPRRGRASAILALVLLLLTTSACNMLGPASISNGRLAYNEAITVTNNQQMLMVLVRNRYGESNSLLSIASITANVSVGAASTIQAGFGAKDNYVGNLVPFAGRVIYEENPTISYVPVAGEQYFAQMTSPVPVALLPSLALGQHEPEYIFAALIASVNDIDNPGFLYPPLREDTRFADIVDLLAELARQRDLRWVSEPGPGLAVSGSPSTAAKLAELAALELTPLHKGLYFFPVAGAGGNENQLKIETRSVLELIEILSSRVKVPQGDIASGVAIDYPPTGLLGQQFSVRYSKGEPTDAYVAVEYRDGWYYIAESDQATKRHFKLLGGLWSAAMHNAISGQKAPVLTVPVSR